MIVYKDRAFCMQDCGRDECIRNKKTIPWENQLPVSFIRTDDCVNWEKPRNMRSCGDFYVREDDGNE